MDKLLKDAVRFLLSQHLDHFHPKVQAEAKEHLSAIDADVPTEGHSAEEHRE